MKDLLLLLSVFIAIAAACLGHVPQNSPLSIPILRTVALGDLDGDGVEDYAVSDFREINPITSQFGSVRLISSATDSVITTYWGFSALGFYGYSLASGDFNGDGTINLIVAAVGGTAQRLEIIDPKTNVLVAVIPVPTSTPPNNGSLDLFGYYLDMRDMDGDGKEEILACSSIAGVYPTQGIVHVFSGGSGAQLHSLSYLAISDFARTAHFLGNNNGSGSLQILVTAPWANQGTSQNHGYVGVYDLTNGTVLHSTFGLSPGSTLGEAATVVGDTDGDGFQDFMVTESDATLFGIKKITTRSGLSGSNISSTLSALPNMPTDLSRSIADLDGDGLRDIAVVTSSIVLSNSSQFVDLYSSSSLRLLDHLLLPVGSGAATRSFTVMSDVGGDGFEDLILDAYKVSGAPGAVTRITMSPVLSTLASGNHPSGSQLLRVNGSAGLPARRVDLAVNQSFAISFDADPLTSGATDFIIFGMFGVPDAMTVYSSSIGDFVFPPSPTASTLPWLFTLADSLAFDPGALFSPGPAPFSLPVIGGVTSSVRFVLQGVAVTNIGNTMSISNAVLINII